jgi:carbon storage regulator
MLVLSRTSGEEIIIGRDIVVSVLSVRNGRVRIGISAPPEVPIVRQELQEALIASDAARSIPMCATH